MEARAATPEDARAIADVHVRTWQTAYRHVFPAAVLDAITVDERENVWRQILADAGTAVFVAHDGDRIVGFASVGPARDEEDTGELYAIYVLPELWGAGYSHELMQSVLAWLMTEQYVSAILWVLDDNPRARRFYEREGWRHDGERLETLRGVEVSEARYHLTLVGA